MASIVLLWWDLCSITSLDASLCAVITGLHTMSTLNWHWIISMHPAELWSQSSLVDFQSYRNKTKKTNSFSTPLHPYPWFFPSFLSNLTCILHYWCSVCCHVLFTSLVYFTPILTSIVINEFISTLIWFPRIPPSFPPKSPVSSLSEHMRHTPESLGQSRIRAERAT